MNETKYKQHLEKYYRQFSGEKFDQERLERLELCKAVRKFDKKKLLKATEDDLVELISPLWAILMWGNRQKHILKLIEDNGLDFLRNSIANLLYGSNPLEKRWDDFRKNVKGMGPAIMSELLCKTYHEECILWNIKAVNAFKNLDIKVPNSQSLDGASYVKLSAIGKELIVKAKESGFVGVEDFLSLDYFFWKELQDTEDKTEVVEVKETIEVEKEKDFIHNDIRDKIMDIGSFLGFESKVEVSIAVGAKVDAIWQASIGNMGRVIYVFEVQTSGSIDSLILNLIKAKQNKAVQGIVAVSDEVQIEKIRKEAEAAGVFGVKFWNYKDVIKTHLSLSSAMESINSLGLVPDCLIK